VFQATKLKRAIFFIFFDSFISLGTLFLAYNLRFNFHIPSSYLHNFFLLFLLLTSLKIVTMSFFNIYKVSWRYFSLNELKKIIYAHFIVYPLMVVIYYIVPELFNPFPRSVLIIDMFLSIMFIGFFRILKRLILENDKNLNMKKTLIIGVNTLAQSIIKEKMTYNIKAIADENLNIVGSYFSNMKVYSVDSIDKIIKNEVIESVIITKEYEANILNKIYDSLKSNGIDDIKIVSLNVRDSDKLKSLSVEDLLARNPKDLDKEKIASFIKDKCVMVTGAGGSIGSELCRQCEKYGAKRLILLDHSEFNLYTIAEEINNVEKVSVLENILDKNLLENTFNKYNPDIVLHAAAYKHVPLVEENIYEGIANNVQGTKNVIDLSIKYGVKKFVMISTDKAVRPTNVMGATKRICELYSQNVVSKDTEIVAVRFGNVLGSSGSVIPKFRYQIEQGGPVTVTHPDITRYFMLIHEACELVLQTASIGRGGKIFILDMGKPVKIVDLAKKMIELSRANNIEIVFTGLRAGEKLYEELLLDKSCARTQYDSITIAEPTKYNITRLNQDIKELLACEDKLSKLKEIVPEFNHQKNLLF